MSRKPFGPKSPFELCKRKKQPEKFLISSAVTALTHSHSHSSPASPPAEVKYFQQVNLKQKKGEEKRRERPLVAEVKQIHLPPHITEFQCSFFRRNSLRCSLNNMSALGKGRQRQKFLRCQSFRSKSAHFLRKRWQKF